MGKIFGKYESGTCDLLDLAAEADYLFPLPDSVKPPGGGGERKEEADEHEAEYDNEDDFREAVELRRSPGRFATSSADDPVSHFLRRIGLGCLLGYLDPAAERQRQESADEDDKLGEEGDESPESDYDDGNRGGSDDERENGHRDEPKRRAPPQDGVFTIKQVARRRRSLAYALNRFDEWLNGLARDPSVPTDDVPAKVAFMLSVMDEAARLRHKMEDGSTETLMTVVPMGSDRDFSVAVRAAKVLSTIWRGLGHTPPLVQRLKSNSPRARIRMEAAAFAEKSRWMIARCLLTLEEVGSHPGLEAVIEKAAIGVVMASYRLDVPDRAKEELDICKLETTAGGEPSRTKAIMSRIEQLATGVPRTKARILDRVHQSASRVNGSGPLGRDARPQAAAAKRPLIVARGPSSPLHRSRVIQPSMEARQK
jgi:hypothetical protein